jgi:ribosome biogenesis GTPase
LRYEDEKPYTARTFRSGVRHEQKLREAARRAQRAAREQRREAPREPHETATVVSLAPGRARVRLGDDEVDARLAAAIAATQQTSIAVGDEVTITHGDDGEPPRVEDVLPRRSALSRPDPGNRHRQRVLAANVDLAVVVLSVREPPLRPALIDRFLVALAGSAVAPVLCVNKFDLADADDRAEVDACLAPFRALGIPAFETSVEDGRGLDELRRTIRGQTVVFVGHSGVGKSALQNALDPDGARATGGVRDKDKRGRHTTRGASLRVLPDGTRIIDTAGVREFGLWGLDRQALAAGFPELERRARHCRFRDCSHVVEPDCAVRAAVEAGEIPARRYREFVRLQRRGP